MVKSYKLNSCKANDVCFFLDKMTNGQGNDLTRIPLPNIIISYMRTVARTRAAKTCLGFPRLLTSIFEHYRVNTTEEAPVLVRTTDITMVPLLRKLKIDDTVLANIFGNQQEEQQVEQLEDQEKAH